MKSVPVDVQADRILDGDHRPRTSDSVHLRTDLNMKLSARIKKLQNQFITYMWIRVPLGAAVFAAFDELVRISDWSTILTLAENTGKGSQVNFCPQSVGGLNAEEFEFLISWRFKHQKVE